jgi:DNA-directed RNA polymerase I, II, and III subunit RPABC2
MSATESYFGGDTDDVIDDSSSDSDNNSDSDSSSETTESSVHDGVDIDGVDIDGVDGGDIDGVDLEDEDDEESDADVESDEDAEGGQAGGGRDDPDDDPDYEEPVTKSGKKVKKIQTKIVKKAFEDEMSDDEDEDEDGELYLKKFDKEINENYILNNHPECALQNYDEILAMTNVIRDADNIIIDNLHRTNPFLTKYERARILGQRAKQIETGATPFVKVPENIIDGYLIAEMELQQGRIPFIIRRPLPNGGSEYWKINDLENIAF